jgi:uncharacterized protein YbaA (DUF1428 family)
MHTYIDGFLLCIPREKLPDYTRVATQAGQIWREHGALAYHECAGDDMNAKDMVAFPSLAQAGPDEIVIFSWAVFRSREHRDEANAKIMADPRLSEICSSSGAIFDYKRMAYGGFKTIVAI